MAVIKVPKTPKSAFDKNRRPSGLIQAQIAHLEAAVAAKAPGRANVRSRTPRTEGDAAAYIAELTDRLYSQPTAARADLPEPQRKKARKKTSARKLSAKTRKTRTPRASTKRRRSARKAR